MSNAPFFFSKLLNLSSTIGKKLVSLVYGITGTNRTENLKVESYGDYDRNRNDDDADDKMRDPMFKKHLTNL